MNNPLSKKYFKIFPENPLVYTPTMSANPLKPDSPLDYPNWLTPSLDQIDPNPRDTSTHHAQWGGTSLPDLPPDANKSLRADVELAQFEDFFIPAMEAFANGRLLATTLREDPRGIDYGRFMRWVYRDPERKAIYEEARTIGSTAREEHIVLASEGRLSDGTETMEDVQRSRLRVETLWKLMQAWNEQYAPQKKVDVTVQVDLRGAMEAAQERVKLMQSRLIEGEFERD